MGISSSNPPPAADQHTHHSMKLRALGQSGLQVAPITFGGNVFGWTVDESTSFTLLDTWVDHGMNFVDTANVYSYWVPGHVGGESELIIGKWLKSSGRRDELIVATKVGKDMGDGKRGLRPEYIRAAVDASLQRLQTDYIDLYQTHDDDLTVPLEDTLGAFADLIAAGKVRSIGASNYSAERLQAALETSERFGLPRFESLQPQFNLYSRKIFEEKLQPLCLAKSVGVINFYALASGFLTGKYRSVEDAQKSQRGAKAVAYLTERGLRILAALDTVADQYRLHPGQVALAWQIAQPAITAPIASATSVEQLREIIDAASVQLDAESMTLLNSASIE